MVQITSVGIVISIHAPVKGATLSVQQVRTALGISIHAPVKGATLFLRQKLLTYCHFNPRSREGSDSQSQMGRCAFEHFNPRSREGSDEEILAVRAKAIISIHAPVKGATLSAKWLSGRYTNFNPRSREGSDRVTEQ